MVFPREVLNDLKWHRNALDEAEVTYIHRGAPGNVMTVRGRDITALGRSFFEVGDSSIPYHRIVAISLRGENIWPDPTART
jgi:uncharacterized protein (UPF0248 family)